MSIHNKGDIFYIIISEIINQRNQSALKIQKSYRSKIKNKFIFRI